MTELELWIDQRERHVIPYFDALEYKNMPCSFKLKTLTSGDYAVVYKNYIIMLIERKSWNDLAATFIDRSRKFNYEKMIEERNKFNCRLFYLIEGKRPSHNIHHVTVGMLEAHLDHLLFDHNIVSIYSNSVEHTPERILSLIRHYLSAHTNPFKELEAKLSSLVIENETVDPATPVYQNPAKIEHDPNIIINFSEIPVLNMITAENSLTTTKKNIRFGIKLCSVELYRRNNGT